jgi:hypothetical protein
VTWIVLALLQEPRIEVEVRAASVHPKFRLRDGETSLKGESVFSRELDAEDDVFSPGLELRMRWDDEAFHASFWQLTAEGSGTLDEDKNWGGAAVPAGTAAEAEVLFRRFEVGWRHRFILYDSFAAAFHAPAGSGGLVWLDAGLDLEYLVVDADLGFGGTRLGGVYPALQLEVGLRFFGLEWLELTAGAGGFFIPFRTGDTSELDPIEYRVAVRARWDRFSLALAYDLTHVHLEENSGDVEEDIVHVRLRSVVAAVEVRF